MNGYNFTDRVRRVLAAAREEAAAMHHEYVGTEHILLGILRENDGVAIAVLRNLEIDLDALRRNVALIVKQGNASYVTRADLPYATRAKRVLELAMAEAREMNHSYVGTEHALLGLLGEGQGIGAQVLLQAGVTLEAARVATHGVVGSQAGREVRKSRPRFVNRMPVTAERVRQIISAAHDIAGKRNSPVLEPAHVAMALVEHEGGLANAALDRLRFDRVAALTALNDVSPAGTQPIFPDRVIEPSPTLLAAIEAMETEDRGDTPASTNHLLIALLNSCVEIDAVFAAQNISASAIDEQVRHLSG